MHQNRLLLVNAYPGDQSDLWCAPGGGVNPGQSLPDNLKREVYEETSLEVEIGAPCLINEFHDPDSGFHQIEVFFHATVADPTLPKDWQDPENVVSKRQFVNHEEYQSLTVRPLSLEKLAWGKHDGLKYDPLEIILRSENKGCHLT